MSIHKKMGILLLGVMLLNISFVYGGFKDTISHWSRDYIIWGTRDVQLLTGYENRTFQPDNNISRAEFMTLLNKLLEEQQLNGEQHTSNQLKYGDLTEDFWGYDHIASLSNYINYHSKAKLKLGSIFTEAELKLNEPITRYEAALLIRNLVDGSFESDSTFYRDLSTRFKYYNEIMELSYAGIISGYEDGTFRPFRNMTRAESVATIKKTHDYLNNAEEDHPVREEIKMEPEVEPEIEPEIKPEIEPEVEAPVVEDNVVEIDRVTTTKNTELLQIEVRDSIELSPLFTVGANEEDEKFINVVATLEYLSIVDYIPYEERHLYDLTPIDTLWELKNENYHNVLGNNFYLLMYDENLEKERKTELVREAMDYYSNLEGLDVKGMESFFKIANGFVSTDELLEPVQKYLGNVENREAEHTMKMLLAEIYYTSGKYQEALGIYEALVGIQYNDIVVETMIAINYGYIINEVEGPESALVVLEELRNKIQDKNNYYFNQEKVDEYFSRAIESIE
ncbi:S-layer domain protein [Alkaliphilus metalliredigens QYMF]|uniref:S-layer domain protein n=1 Tax=Alkaliphilus metalliredigens (strain QYMF) TaxID=293826 RepID=A6TQ91_ALKMQ|nr:S-layer homology domain-containing protein [Alkaliphilus metalliredigens]ABR48359.1 S-layer domain protein [Alkaliphilus metalliredigens QYMF]